MAITTTFGANFMNRQESIKFYVTFYTRFKVNTISNILDTYYFLI